MKALFRIGLFCVTLFLGTSVALVVGETSGLALADLSTVPVETIAKATTVDTMYATLGGENSGVFHSNDSGLSWQRISAGPATISTITTHPTNENRLFAGSEGGSIEAGDTSVWYSDDKGRSWDQYGFTLPANPQGELPQVSALRVDPNHPGILYVGTQGAGLFRVQGTGFSRVGGVSLYSLYVNDIVVTADSPVYAITTEGLLAIEGDSWHKIDMLPDGIVTLTIDPNNPNLLYAGTVGYGAYRSGNGGQSWQPINEGLGLQPGVILRVPAIAIDEQDPQHLAVATAIGVGSHLVGDGVYESFDAGESWTKLGQNQDIVNSLMIEDGGILAATHNGLVRYGAPVSSDTLQTRVNRFTTPTGLQSIILVITVAVAAWLLVGRLSLLPKPVEVTI